MEGVAQGGECFVRGALALTLQVSRALGVAPLRIERVRMGWRVSFSKPFAVYSYALAFLLHAVIFTALWLDMNCDVDDAILMPSTTLRLVIPFEVLVIVTTVSLVVYQARMRMEKIIAAQNTLHKIQMDLNKYIESSTENKKHICAVVCLLFASYPTFQYLYSDLTKVLQQGKSPFVVYLNALFYVELFILNLLTLQFLFITMNIKATFEGINDIFEQRISVIEKKWSTESKDSIRHLTHSFATVCDVMRDIDDCFSDALMLIVSSFLMLLLVVPFYFFHNLLNGLTDTTDIVLRAGTIVALIVSLIVVCEPGHRTEDELQRMRSLADRLLRLVSANPREDLAQELDLLFKQINSNRVAYMPFDMITLDRSLILGVLGTAITLIVIVLQYQLLEQQQSQMENRAASNITTESP